MTEKIKKYTKFPSGVMAPAEEVKEPETAEIRYKDAVPLDEFRAKTIGIAGLGATGKQVATILSVMGHKGVWGADPDKVEMKNLGTQGWSEQDIGEHKAAALMDSCSNRRSTFYGRVNKFEDCFSLPQAIVREDLAMQAMMSGTDVFFCCVDTMQARTAIWQELKRKRLLQGPKLWVESRIVSRVIRIMTIDLGAMKEKEYYESTLYSDTEAFQGSCTDRMTYYGAGIAAGLMVSQLVNWLKYKQVTAVDFVIETAGMGITRIK